MKTKTPKSQNRAPFLRRKTALAAGCAWALSLLAQQAAAGTPYPYVPLNWQSGVVTVKPNILLFLDTSGSMANLVSGTGKTRLQTAKDVISDVITNTREKNRWGLATFLPGTYAFNSISAGDVAQTSGPIWSGYASNRETTANENWLYNMGAKYYFVNGSSWTSIGGQVLMNVDDISSDSVANRVNYSKLMTTISSLPANTNTPITTSYYELLRYYRGETTGIPGLKAPDGSYQYTSPIQYRCQSNHIIYISDGEPTGFPLSYQMGKFHDLDPWAAPATNTWVKDNAMYNAQPAAAKTAIQSARALTQQLLNTSADTGIAAHLAEAAYLGDMMTTGTDLEGVSFQDPQYPNQNIKTYTVGFAANVALLRNMGQLGGGEYFTADNGAGLKAALESAVSSIARDSGYTNAAVSVSVSQSNQKEITAAAATTFDPESWTSQLRFYQYINNSFDLNTYTTPIYTDGKTITSRALISTDSGVANIAPNTYGSLNNTTFGISGNRTGSTANLIAKSTDTNEYRRLMAWLLRWNASDVPDSTFANYRDRNQGDTASLARYMGDVTGNVLQIGDIKVTAANSSDFDRKEFLLVPSNDGMMHILTANTGNNRSTKPYIERLQYLPGTAQRDTSDDNFIKGLVLTAELTYGNSTNPKQNFLAGESHSAIGTDGEISVLNAFGQGGRGVFSLMVGGKDHNNNAVGMHRPESDWASSVPLWDMSTTRFGGAGSFYSEIGYNFGTPKVGYVNLEGQATAWNGDVRAGALVTSGFDNPNKNQPGLYILDHFGKTYSTSGRTATVTPGTLLKKIPIKRAYTAATNSQATAAEILAAHDGLTSAQAIDLDENGIMDLAYAGDYKGNIWRFDLRGDMGEWDSRLIFTGTGSQPLMAEPNLINYTQNGKHVVGVYFGTGSNLYQGDMYTNTQQSMYGVFDHVSDCAVNAAETGLCAPATQADLIQQQWGGDRDQGMYIATNTDYSDSANRRGFYFNLPTGYRIVTTPEAVKVRGRKSYGLIWNLEYIDSTNSGASKVTCTPSSNTYGVRVITNAENGQESQYVKWNNSSSTTSNGQTKTIVSIAYNGASSRTALLTSGGNYSETAIGTIKQSGGLLRKPGQSIPPQPGCSDSGTVGSGTSLGMDLQKILCDDLGGSLTRLSWREIF